MFNLKVGGTWTLDAIWLPLNYSIYDKINQARYKSKLFTEMWIFSDYSVNDSL